MVDEEILKNMVRIGEVSDTNSNDRTARVIFHDLNDMVSGWMKVLQHPYAKSVYWMPSVNQTVLCLYLPVWNGDGIILGVL